MSADPRKLESRLGRIRGRSQYVPHDAAIALGAFVCPRADGYGAREGVIPPGVAAQHGLIPKGLREVSSDAALHSARQDDANPVSAQDQYRAYYGRGARQRPAGEPAGVRVALPPEPPREPPASGPDVDGALEPPTPVTPVPAVPRVVKRAPARTPAPVPVKAAKAAKPQKPRKTPTRKPVPPAPGVFSSPDTEATDPDTLEGFYAGLRDPGWGTRDPDGDWPELPESEAGVPTWGGGKADEGAGGAVPPVPLPRPRGDDDARRGNDLILQGLREQLAEQRQLAKDWYEEAERRRLDLERHQILISHQNTELQRLTQEAAAARTSHDDGPVRVYLGAEDVKLKVAGRGWDCNVIGHLCYSRGRTEVALVVMDPAYGSDLLGSAQEGDCVLVSAEGRTACQYRGHCDKIYGEQDSQDFITVMRFSCDPARAQA